MVLNFYDRYSQSSCCIPAPGSSTWSARGADPAIANCGSGRGRKPRGGHRKGRGRWDARGSLHRDSWMECLRVGKSLGGPDWPLGMGGRSCPQRLVLMVSLEKDLECQFLLAPITSDLKEFHRTASVLCLRKSP